MRKKSTAHGTIYSYEHGCRCEKCLAGHTRRHIRQRKKRQPDDAPAHGTGYAYREYNCRCDSCTGANAEAVAAIRARRKPRKTMSTHES